MGTVRFTKHQALGNDFLVVIEPGTSDPSVFASWARHLCDRRRGVGADGLLVAEPAPADGSANTERAATMVLYNADGSRAEMSGNGIRCFVQALSRRDGGDLGPITVFTDAGVRLVALSATRSPDTIEATVDMGAVDALDEPAGWEALGCHPDRPVAHLSLGNPHSVVGVDDVAAVDLGALGAKVPQVNLEIVAPGTRQDTVRMRVHERGAGITEACGTGACAAAFAAARWGLATPRDGKLVVEMDGGAATVTLDEPAPGRVTLTGPATFVASIEIPRHLLENGIPAT